MKKFFLFLIAGLFLSLDSPAQDFLNSLNKAINGLSQQRNSQRSYNRQRSYERRQSTTIDKHRDLNGKTIEEKSEEKGLHRDLNGETPREKSKEESLTTQKQNSVSEQLSNEKVITLVVDGTGKTKEEATKNALRSAIEQAFGTFVSANTEVLNDELIKDEIVTVSTGNIKTYKELSISQDSDGLYDASIQATVSIDQLTKFAQSKGMQAELAGAAFVMNMKMRELNKENELVAIMHMINKIAAIAENGLFDYKAEIGEPRLTKYSNYEIKIEIKFCENANTVAFYKTLDQTLRALSLSEKEQEEYKKVGLKLYYYTGNLYPTKPEWGKPAYVLRNSLPYYRASNYEINIILPIIVESALNYEIMDNLGNKYYTVRRKLDTKEDYDFWQYINGGKNYTCEWYFIDDRSETLWYYELTPHNGLKAIYNTIGLKDTHSNMQTFTRSFNALPWRGQDEVDSNKVYYFQEFSIIYTEKGLSNLKKIMVNRR